MRKKIRGMLLLLLAVLLVQGTAVLAAQKAGEKGSDPDSAERVYDMAGLLSEEEIADLQEDIDRFEEKSGWRVFAVTTDDAEGKSTTAYADDFFDLHSPDEEDGVTLLIDMDHREITVSTCGEAIRYLTDQRIELMLDKGYTYVSKERYGQCFIAMLGAVSAYYNVGIPRSQYNYDTQTGRTSRYHALTAGEFFTALLVAILVGVIFYIMVKAKYHSSYRPYEYNIRHNGRMSLRVREDKFESESTTQRRIQTSSYTSGDDSDSSSSSRSTRSSADTGRSSTHTSSSGRTHGGGSRSF